MGEGWPQSSLAKRYLRVMEIQAYGRLTDEIGQMLSAFLVLSGEAPACLGPDTILGIDGYAFSSSRIRGSNSSATDPFGSRSYLGGPSDRSAARTVFRDTFLIRAICLTGRPPARWSRLISAQSSTLIISFLPGPV